MDVFYRINVSAVFRNFQGIDLLSRISEMFEIALSVINPKYLEVAR
jgi:hypothetical protein